MLTWKFVELSKKIEGFSYIYIYIYIYVGMKGSSMGIGPWVVSEDIK